MILGVMVCVFSVNVCRVRGAMTLVRMMVMVIVMARSYDECGRSTCAKDDLPSSSSVNTSLV